MKNNKLQIVLAVLLAVALLAGCGAASSAAPASTPAASAAPAESAAAPASTATAFAAAMVTDVGGINDESFNQSAWSGMEKLEAEGVTVSFLESEKDADYAPNLEKKADEGTDIVWGIGFLMKTAMGETAEANPDQLFALVDDSFEDGEHDNVIGVMFMAEQSSFLVGYAAALKTETDHVGIILGMESPTMNRFTNGFRAGIAYGAAELGKEIKIDYQVAEAFDDPAKGKALAQKMYTDGADIVYQVAGDTGKGIIEAAKEMDKWVIGVDLDQNHLAPDNVICSGLKNVGAAVFDVSMRVKAGEELGGTTLYMGLAEGGAGIATTGNLLGDEIIAKVDAVEQLIVDGTIEVPYDEAGLTAFMATLETDGVVNTAG